MDITIIVSIIVITIISQKSRLLIKPINYPGLIHNQENHLINNYIGQILYFVYRQHTQGR